MGNYGFLLNHGGSRPAAVSRPLLSIIFWKVRTPVSPRQNFSGASIITVLRLHHPALPLGEEPYLTFSDVTGLGITGMLGTMVRN